MFPRIFISFDLSRPQLCIGKPVAASTVMIDHITNNNNMKHSSEPDTCMTTEVD
jgi:hypothetical protein